MRDPALFTWAMFVLAIPFYVFSSGLPQPGDALLIPLALFALHGWRGRLNSQSVRTLRALLLFTTWVLIVDWGWATMLGNFGLFGKETFLLFPVYYVYNTLVFLVVCVLYERHRERFLWLTLHVVLLSVLMQVVASLIVPSKSFRGIGFFNNPNQLGFYALVSASVLALGKRSLGFGSLKSGLGLTSCLYLALVSASRAAVVGIGILFVLSLISSPKRIVVASLVLLAFVAVGGPIANAIDSTQQRMTENRFPQMNFFQERGYDRILAHKEYWLLGAGEGGTDRFAATTMIGATEVHSSAGTIFFSYGIVGVGLFLSFLLRVVRGAGLRSMLYLAPTISYTFAHQGLRSTSFWILFALFVAVKHLDLTKRSAPDRALTLGAAP